PQSYYDSVFIFFYKSLHPPLLRHIRLNIGAVMEHPPTKYHAASQEQFGHNVGRLAAIFSLRDELIKQAQIQDIQQQKLHAKAGVLAYDDIFIMYSLHKQAWSYIVVAIDMRFGGFSLFSYLILQAAWMFHPIDIINISKMGFLLLC
ncbi:hypothetical protein ACJX0J_022935, partial [Zea mays]